MTDQENVEIEHSHKSGRRMIKTVPVSTVMRTREVLMLIMALGGIAAGVVSFLKKPIDLYYKIVAADGLGPKVEALDRRVMAIEIKQDATLDAVRRIERKL